LTIHPDTHPPSHIHHDKLIAVSQPPYYVVGADNIIIIIIINIIIKGWTMYFSPQMHK